MANIRKNKSGSWEARVSYRDAQGKKHERSKSFANKRDATRWSQEVELNLKDGLDKSNGLLTDYFMRWYKIYKKPAVTHRTQLTYEHSYNIIKQYFGKTVLTQITQDKIQQFINAYAQGTPPFAAPHAKESVSKVYTHLFSALKKAVKDGIYRYNPAEDVKVIGVVAPRDEKLKYLNEEDQVKLRKYLLDNLKSPVDYMILTSLDTGMRLGELLGLTWDKVHEDHIEVVQAFDYTTDTITTTKQDNPRTVTIAPDLYKLLKRLEKHSYVFAGSSDEPISTSYISRDFRAIQKRAGIKQPINFHGLRHSHASLLMYKGFNMSFIAKRLGHRDAQTTIRIYAHILNELNIQETEKLAAMFEKEYRG